MDCNFNFVSLLTSVELGQKRGQTGKQISYGLINEFITC